MDIYFMRHGETPYNQKHLLQGQRDIALNDAGKAQAEKAAKWFQARGIQFSRVYASPLSRAVETASLVSGCPQGEIKMDPRLLEIDFGPIEGKKWEDLSAEEMEYVNDPWKGTPIAGVEDADHLISRVNGFLDAVKQAAQGSDASAAEETVLAVTHGMALHGILTALTGDRACWKTPLGNCCIFYIRTDGESFSNPERMTPPVPTFR